MRRRLADPLRAAVATLGACLAVAALAEPPQTDPPQPDPSQPAWPPASPQPALPRPLRADHPLLGNWRFTLASSGCVETHLVRPDGTTIVTSGEEVSESAIAVDDVPGPDGTYRWVDRIVRNNGRPDCSGSRTPIGDVATTWFRFSPDRERIVVCLDRTMTRCFGPLVRVHPGRGG